MASCHSEIIAQVFVAAGASHVVCIVKDEKISDEICKTFAEYYYQAYFCENQTFCEAFESAKRKISANKIFNGEEKKFKLLLRSSHLGQDTHRCTRFFTKPSPEAKFIDFTPVPHFSIPHFYIEGFMGRNKELYEVTDLLLNNRLVTIRGTIGVGKSSLVKELANKLMDRGTFQHGLIYIDMGKGQSIEKLLSVLTSDITVSKLVRKRSAGKELDLAGNIQELVRVLAEYKVLMIFDNLDLLYHKGSAHLRQFINGVLTETPYVRMLITIFSRAESIRGSFKEEVYELGPLSDHFAAQLLTKRATRKFTDAEVAKLFTDHPCSYEGKPILENHKLIKLFKGLPQVILMAASILHEKTLSEIYAQLTAKNNVTGLQPLLGASAPTDTIQNSLSLAMEIINELDEVHNLNLVTFFPAGILESDLEELWGPEYSSHLNKLLNFNVLYKQSIEEDKVYFTLNG